MNTEPRDRLAEHRGSKPPREKKVRGVLFLYIYRGADGSAYWWNPATDTIVGRKFNLRGDEYVYYVSAPDVSLKTRFRSEERALDAAAKIVLQNGG